MTTSLIWILYRSDSDTAYKETLNCKKIIEGYGKKVLFSEISNETNNIIKIDYSTILWTAGLKPSKSKFVHHFLNENQKIKVNQFMQMNEYKNIYKTEDIISNKINPDVIARYDLNDGNYTILS